jgi:Rrf2 family protein
LITNSAGLVDNRRVRVSAKAEYAVRAAMELAAAPDERPVKKSAIVDAQRIPGKFLENILSELRNAGLVESQRGSDGGYWLARPASEISVADVMRAVEGPLASVRSQRPEALEYEGLAEPLQKLWVALRASIRDVLEHVTLRDLVDGKLPKEVLEYAEPPDAWVSQ